MFKKTITILFFLVSFLLVAVEAKAASIYVDNTLDSDCVSGNYSISARNCSGNNGRAYDTIQGAINAMSSGDVVYMRGGTYREIDIDIPESKNGTSDSNRSRLISYPGEWAVVDASGLNSGASAWSQNVFRHPINYGTGDPDNYTRYWTFSNFEVTGGRSGFFLKLDHVDFRYMYIHDNVRERGSTDTLTGGIVSVCPMYSTVEYSYFANNIQSSGSDMNNSNILFDSDYGDSNGRGEAFNSDAATHHNEIRYNYLTGSRISLRQKNQQRFGYNDRNPDDMTYKDFGDKWHHNIILDATESIGASQDFIQIYNNITDSTINFGRQSGGSGDIPIVYNGTIYNNTVKRDSTDSSYGSYATSGGYSTAKLNYYGDNMVHEHVWFLNNIASNNTSAYQDFPFMFHWNIPANTSSSYQNNSDIVVDRNLIHANNNARDYVVGHNYDSSYTRCDNQYITSSLFDACTESWRGISGIANWDENDSLFVGSSGANQYVASSSFSLGGANTIANGGKGGNHPYLSGVAFPDYIGAANPNDHDWVDGVLNEVTSIAWLRDRGSGDPDWIEGSGNSSPPISCFDYNDNQVDCEANNCNYCDDTCQENSCTIIRADVNQDSQITSTDAMLTLRKSLNSDMSGTNWQDSPTTGDVNCDGNTSSTDAMLILRYSLGLSMNGTRWCE